MKNTAVRDTDGADLNRFETLEKAVELQNKRHARTDESIREMIETFKLMTSNNPMNPSTSETQTNDPYRRHRTGHQLHYSGMMRLAKVDFPRFNGENVKEWLFKFEEFFGIDNTLMDM